MEHRTKDTLTSDRQILQSLTKRDANICFALFIVGGLAGLLQLSSPLNFGSGYEMVALGRNLAGHGTFANPFAPLATGPTAANPPMYPFFLAILFKLLRAPSLVLFAAAISNVVANALTAAWLPRVSILFYQSITPGVIASLLWLAAAQLMPAWDASFTVAGLLLFTLYSASKLESDKPVYQALPGGVLAGALFLLNPSTSLIMLPLIVHFGATRKASFKHATMLLMVLFAIVIGWAIRNDIQLGKPVIRTNLGMTLWASNNDCAQPSMLADEANNCFQSHHPNVSPAEAQLVKSIGEVEYDRRRTADARSWIKEYPRQFLHLTMIRFRQFWFPPGEAIDASPIKAWTIWLTTALSIPGLIFMIKRREPATLVMLAILVIYPGMYYIVVSDVRYRYPVLWLSELAAGYFVDRCWNYLNIVKSRRR